MSPWPRWAPIAVLFAIGIYPLWSVTIMVMYGLIIYGLTLCGFGEDQTP